MARKPARTEPDATNGGKSARTRQRILDAAAHVLSRKGFAGTRLTDVAEVAELQAPAIYYYFPSREDLIEEVMWSGITHMADHVRDQLDALPPELSAMDRIDAAVEAHLRYQLDVSDYTTAAIRNVGQLPEELRVRYGAEANRYGETWRKLFQAAKREGSLRDDLDPRVARMLVLGALNWAAEWWNPRRGSLDHVIRSAKSIVRAGLSAPDEGEAAAPVPQRNRAKKAPAGATSKSTR